MEIATLYGAIENKKRANYNEDIVFGACNNFDISMIF